MARMRDLAIEEAPFEAPDLEPFAAGGLLTGARPAPLSLGHLMQFRPLPIAASSRHWVCSMAPHKRCGGVG
jgi:hypothetical protein